MADVGIGTLSLPLVQKETHFVVFLGVLHSKFLGVLLSLLQCRFLQVSSNNGQESMPLTAGPNSYSFHLSRQRYAWRRCGLVGR
ncbi:hypothetical protein TNCV_1772711 [Trichonephila clavipes]|nr:hypothetical protein TNCV_1772711 [Trichonephila clavipes]